MNEYMECINCKNIIETGEIKKGSVIVCDDCGAIMKCTDYNEEFELSWWRVMDDYKMGDIVWGRSYDEYYGRWSEWEKTEFLKEDEDLEYGRYVCLTWTHDGKIVDCFDEIKPYNTDCGTSKEFEHTEK